MDVRGSALVVTRENGGTLNGTVLVGLLSSAQEDLVAIALVVRVTIRRRDGATVDSSGVGICMPVKSD